MVRLLALLGNCSEIKSCMSWPMLRLSVALLLGLGSLLLFVFAEDSPAAAHFWAYALLLSSAGLFAYEALRQQRLMRTQALLMDGAHDGIFEWDPISKRLNVGSRLLSILGYEENFLKDTHSWLPIIHPEDRDRYNKTVADHLKGLTEHFYCEYRVRARSGEYRWLAARGKAQRNRRGRAVLMAGSISDITERVERSQQMHSLAFNDHLTGLPNRRSLVQTLPAVLEACEGVRESAAVLYIDLDRFKNINDVRGHGLGDAVLCEVTQRIRAQLSPADACMRHGGDELVVVLVGALRADRAVEIAEGLRASIESPIGLEGYNIHVTASIGVARYPADGSTAEQLLRCADLAMHDAKKRGGNAVSLYAATMRQSAQQRALLEERLRRAIEEDQLLLHFQPQFRFADGVLIGAEALVRWRDGDNLVSPADFIPLAEETGLIVPLGRWVIESAIAQLAAWMKDYDAGRSRPFRISINLSPRQFQRSAVQHEVLQAIRRHAVPADLIELEVTESVVLGPDGSVHSALDELRSAGCRIALDDFGTGYCSLSYLQQLEIDTLKIDKSFVRHLAAIPGDDSRQSGAAIVSAMITLAQRLNYEVVAEGVETDAQFAWLKDAGCGVCQGYYFSPPLPAEEFELRYWQGNAQSCH